MSRPCSLRPYTIPTFRSSSYTSSHWGLLEDLEVPGGSCHQELLVQQVPCPAGGTAGFGSSSRMQQLQDSAAGGRLCSGSAALALSLEGALGQSQLLT